jgi:hypothetical protein
VLRSIENFREAGSKVFRPAPTDKRAIRAWLVAAQAKAADSAVEAVSLDTRVEAAYDAVFNCCLAVINAKGYRLGAAPGHHEEGLEAACAIVAVGEAAFGEIDALRELRNHKYTGTPRTVQDLADATRVMDRFTETVVAWFRRAHPQLLEG